MSPFRRFTTLWFPEVGWRYLVAIAAVIVSLFPVVFVVSAALNPQGTLSSAKLIPDEISATNFQRLLTETDFPRWFANSILIATFSSFGAVFVSALAAYAFSRFRFRGRRPGLMFLLLVQMFPQFLAVVTIYLIFARVTELYPPLGFNSGWGLMLLYLGGALGVNTWLMKGFFDTVPSSLDEAATIDGASHAQTFFRILLPLVAPVLAVVGLLSFITIMNEFLLANIFLTQSPSKTLAVGLYGLVASQRDNNFGLFCAGTLLTAIPTVAIFYGLQRFIVGGLTAGAVKG
ncbi:ABC transporter permease subunit [Microbacterium sp. BK668]|uniref:sugar ABC transporter permease n=1 Tax=Microbacterium sp. BK668 TaxID=2512118 RepID=UPI00105B20B1|nr:ABC transporter permease subunit [Microbacterium sp. BK668]TDN90750.1 carbohydrate ABC transporter membrane protein 2 (CUT1 family) [Microbacterium sp. BK668]